MQVQQEFVSVGVNRIVNALSWSSHPQHSLVAYGAHHMVALYDPVAAQVVGTMLGHSNMVNCVAWVPSEVTSFLPQAWQLLISGSADQDLRVWAVHKDARGPQSWKLLAVLKGHTGPVTSVTIQPLPQSEQVSGGFLLVSTAGDPDVHIWQCTPSQAMYDSPSTGSSTPNCTNEAEQCEQHYGQGSWKCLQKLHVGTQMQQAVELTHLPGLPDWLLLVTGGTDARLHLYVRQPAGTFQPALKLPGHEGWIRALCARHVTGASGAGRHTELLLASASQDRYGRIWKVVEESHLLASDTPQGTDADTAAIMRYAPRPSFEAAGRRFCTTLEALLIGHEDWVHSCAWAPVQGADKTTPVDRQQLVLLTASMDRTMMLWTYEASSGLWMSVSSVGDAGATCLGYFGGIFSGDGSSIMAHGFTGALHLWDKQSRAGAASSGAVEAAQLRHVTWMPRHALGGHWDVVTQVAWGIAGSCVISVSADQTARVFTETCATAGAQEGAGHWCEIARPQVHGHDFSCLAVLPRGTQAASYAYVSGSEEKVLRVMEATQAFNDTLSLLRGQPYVAAADQGGLRARAFGAAVAALGLTNKMVLEETAGTRNAGVDSGMSGGGYEEGPDFVPNAAPAVVREPPLEEHLAQNTLWPEAYKLYGHGDSLYCCAASLDGSVLASACVAKSEQQAAVWVWDVAGGTFKALAQLQGHTLTVTQLSWSHNSRMLATCSRDRTFCIFQRTAGQEPGHHTFSLVHRQKAAHSRILWGISWSHDDAFLATGARDNLVKIWAVRTSEGQGAGAVQVQQVLVLPALPAAVTSVAWAPCHLTQPGNEVAPHSYLLAVGLESGSIQLWRVQRSDADARTECVWQSGELMACAAQVNSMCWKQDASGSCWKLAVGGNDHSVRVFNVQQFV